MSKISLKTIVFDLDDTLVSEVEYLMSAFEEIAHFIDNENKNLLNDMLKWHENKENVFFILQKKYEGITITDLKNKYRTHIPKLNTKSKNRELLIELKNKGYTLGLISDGYSVTQRNKLKALDIESLFDLIIISEEFGSEKPNEKNYTEFNQFLGTSKYYIGDNYNKDFLAPNKLGWTTIGLIDDGRNIHKQNCKLDNSYLPSFEIKSLQDIKKIIQ